VVQIHQRVLFTNQNEELMKDIRIPIWIYIIVGMLLLGLLEPWINAPSTAKNLFAVGVLIGYLYGFRLTFP
jgi:hypothetical protein